MASNAPQSGTAYNYQPSFSAYLHNPYGFPLEIEKKAIEKFTNIIDVTDYLEFILNKYFGDRNYIQRKGLSVQYLSLKNYVVEKKLIGMIYYGADGSKPEHDKQITEYTNTNGNTLSLTINSICKYLLEEFIKRENVEELCRISLT